MNRIIKWLVMKIFDSDKSSRTWGGGGGESRVVSMTSFNHLSLLTFLLSWFLIPFTEGTHYMTYMRRFLPYSLEFWVNTTNKICSLQLSSSMPQQPRVKPSSLSLCGLPSVHLNKGLLLTLDNHTTNKGLIRNHQGGSKESI